MTQAVADTPSVHRPLLLGLERGLRRRCPHCGEGRLFKSYIAVEPYCPRCGHDNAQYRADDAGPYFTILLVGHVGVAPILFFPFVWKAPLWIVLATTLPALAGLTLLLLPIVKGAVIGAQWALRRGHDADQPDTTPIFEHGDAR